MLKCLDDLERYKENIVSSKISISEFNKIDNVGGNLKNSYNNKLFTWNFKQHHIESFIECFNNLVETKSIYNFKIKVKQISDKMIFENICPIEAILYASKVINNTLDKNDSFIEALGDLIEYVYLKNPNEYKSTIQFILDEWTFKNQLLITINACGKIKDDELLELIYKKHTLNECKFYALKAFMNVDSEIYIDYVLSMMSTNNESDKLEVDMAKFFINNYKKRFKELGIKKAEKYLLDDSLTKQSKKIISRAIPNVSNVESVTLNTMIKKSKNWYSDENFESYFRNLIADSKTRKDAFLAIRYSNHKNIEKMIIDALDEYDCSAIEIGTALITISQWGSRVGISKNFYELIKKYKNDEDKKIYCYASMCSIGREKETILLIEEYLEQKLYTQRQIFSIIRDCSYKSNKILKKSIKQVYNEYLNSTDYEKIKKAINGAYELCNKPKFNYKEIVFEEIKNFLGMNSNCFKLIKEEVYLSVINLIDRLLDDNSKDEFVDILFFILDNKLLSSEVKFKIISMLKRLSINPPK